jgi:hypothetical protein
LYLQKPCNIHFRLSLQLVIEQFTRAHELLILPNGTFHHLHRASHNVRIGTSNSRSPNEAVTSPSYSTTPALKHLAVAAFVFRHHINLGGVLIEEKNAT